MKTVLIVSNAYMDCKIWTSEPKRMEGFRRYLPDYGWRAALLVKDCNCEKQQAQAAGYDIVFRHEDVDEARSTALVEEKLAQHDSAIIRMQCGLKWFFKTWLKAAKMAGWGFENKQDEREVFHLVHPYPDLRKKEPSVANPFRAILLLVVKGIGRSVKTSEQDRIDWVQRGIEFGSKLVDRGGIDAVIGSFPGIQNLEIAVGISRASGVPWIGDFRDPVKGGWCCSPSIAPRVARLLKTSTAITYASEGCRAIDSDILTRKCVVIVENGFLEEETAAARSRAADAPPSTAMTLRFLGTLYPTRNLDVFLAGLKQFVEAHEVDQEKLRFDYHGVSAKELKAKVEELGLLRYCQVNDSVSGEEALALAAKASVLVVQTNQMGLAGVPGAKLYEYLGCRRPILAVGGRDAYVDGVLLRTGAGVACHTSVEVSSVLGEWFKQWEKTGAVNLQPDEQEIQKHSRRHGAHKLASLLDSVVAARRNG